MTTSTPPAWHWLSECEEPLLSTAPRIPPDTATFRVQNDSDQCANGEQNSPSAFIPSDQCPECRCAPNMPHATGCGWPTHLMDVQTDAVKTHPAPSPCGDHIACPECINREDCDVSTSPDISCDRKYGNLDDGEPLIKVTAPADSYVAARCPVCRHEMETDEGVLCDCCEESIGVESFAVVNGPGGVFIYHLACYDEVYWGERDADDVKVMDTDGDKWSISGDNEGADTSLHAHMRATFDACLAISVAKNADYASSSDPLANFRACQQFGVPLTRGIMVRLSDKFARIGNLLENEAQVKDEAIADSIDDAVNYLAILKYALTLDKSVHS